MISERKSNCPEEHYGPNQSLLSRRMTLILFLGLSAIFWAAVFEIVFQVVVLLEYFELVTKFWKLRKIFMFSSNFERSNFGWWFPIVFQMNRRAFRPEKIKRAFINYILSRTLNKGLAVMYHNLFLLRARSKVLGKIFSERKSKFLFFSNLEKNGWCAQGFNL